MPSARAEVNSPNKNASDNSVAWNNLIQKGADSVRLSSSLKASSVADLQDADFFVSKFCVSVFRNDGRQASATGYEKKATIRDLLWLMVVMGMGCGWWLTARYWSEQNRASQQEVMRQVGFRLSRDIENLNMESQLKQLKDENLSVKDRLKQLKEQPEPIANSATDN